MNTRVATVAAAHGDPFTEAVALTKRLRLPYLRKAVQEIVPIAKAQRWDPAETIRVLLAEEAAGRDAATLRTRRRRAAFSAGKTFDVWDETNSCIPRATQNALRTLEWVTRRENLCICGPSGTD
jgi:DNA replication protein DnaC